MILSKSLLRLFLITCLCWIQKGIAAQDLSNPGNYMSFINQKERDVTQTYLNYLSAVSHGKSARKVEKLREKVVNTIFNTRMEISGTPPYKGDRSLKDASVAHLKIVYSVFNEDYARIVNMEEIAEQSYDAMEAYMLAQQKASEKLAESNKTREGVGKQFAQKFNINLIESKDELGIKAEKSDRVMEYYNKVYLVFFKSFKQDMYLTEAINAGNVNAIEQNKSALMKYADAGIQTLDAMEAFESDLTLVTACKKLLQFYKEMTTQHVQPITDFVLLSENMKKQKKALESTPAAKRTQADIDQFNKSVKEINQALNAFNKTNNELNKERTAHINGWNSAVDKFLDRHIPYSK